MLFNSSTFVVFLLLTLAAYWASPWLLVRRALLLVASATFYAFWDYRFLALLAYVTLVAYGAARAVHVWPKHGRAVIGLSLFLQLGQLAIFKYANFFLTSLGDAAHLTGSSWTPTPLDILLPIGVSFYTFHGISYVVDVYRGKLPRPLSLDVVALYIAFFPQLVAGPIVRADVFIPQTERRLRLDTRDLITAIKLIVIGLVCKGVFADRIGPLVDAVFRAPAEFDNVTLASASLGFYAQIYFDFVGYSTMAIGISRLFGFKLPRNFDFPYRATSITEFWRRWHISLSSWLRDYLYIPLGGNRQGTLKQYRNLILTMLLGGLWHGASYNFVLWGGAHGLGLAAHKLFRSRLPKLFASGPARYAWAPFAWLLTQLFVLAAWVPFRAASFADTRTILHALTFARVDSGLKAAPLPLTLVLLPLLAEHLLLQNPRLPALPWPRRPLLLLALLGLCFALTLPLLELDVQSFIYFQF
jgi:alginate O-acetyltransferase complex protein AlgI